MDFNSSLKTTTILPKQKHPERKLLFNTTKEGSISSQKHSQHTKNDDNKLPLMMMNMRTPLQSPNPLIVSNRSSLSKREEKLPVKRCFSQEVLELSHQIIVTKHSKVDISMCPPKRIRLDDFAYSANSSRSRQNHDAANRGSTSSNTKRKEMMLRLLKPTPAKLSLPPPDKDVVNMKSPLHHKKDGVRFHPSKSAGNFLSKRMNSTTSQYSHFLVSIKNFPRQEWRENNYDTEMLREIIFLSDANATPVDLIRKDNQLIVKFTNDAQPNIIKRNLSCGQRGIVLPNLLESPFSIPFKVISGVIKWILGK